MKKFFIILFFNLLFILSSFAENEVSILPSCVGLVKSVEYIDLEGTVADLKQVASVKLLNGSNKGSSIKVDNIITGNPYYDIRLKEGMKILLHVEESDGELSFSVEDVYRTNALISLSGIFCALLIFIGRKKGLYSLISIILTGVLIFKILSSMIILGINPVLSSIIICLISTSLTMYLVGGFNRKSTAATLGCILSIIVAAMLSWLTVKIAYLNGFNSEQSIFLYAAHPELNFVAIAISVMLLATLGAVMDVAMSIASTINEIYSIDNTKSVKELFISGMNVGRDIIGTMANTLILVYLGSSLPLLLLASNIDMQKFLNLNQVVTEVSAALIGSIAIMICVPITALVSSKLIKNMPTKIDFSNLKD